MNISIDGFGVCLEKDGIKKYTSIPTLVNYVADNFTQNGVGTYCPLIPWQ
jgi:hypothetical protein